MELQEIIQELNKNWFLYKDALKEGLKNNNPLLNKINEYLLDHCGKELRPVLALLGASSCGTPNEISGKCAAVCEMIHTASLLHDDVIDNGNIRRGAPTVKSFFTPAASVLTGDFWLSRSLFMLTHCGSDILNCYTLAVEELAEGELFQMHKANALDISEDDYYTIIYKKTASLFIAALKSSAISVGATDAETSLIKEYGYHLGVAFQIRDDIFDYSPALNTGKAYGADVRERKITLPLIGAFYNSTNEEKEKVLSSLLNTSLDDEQEQNNLVAAVLKFVADKNGLNYASDKLAQHSKKAIAIINDLEMELLKKSKSLTSSQLKALYWLKVLAEYVGSRKS